MSLLQSAFLEYKVVLCYHQCVLYQSHFSHLTLFIYDSNVVLAQNVGKIPKSLKDFFSFFSFLIF